MKTKFEKITSLVKNGEAILLTCVQSIRWLSGFNYTDGYALVTNENCYVFADFRYIEAARATVKAPSTVVMLEGGKKCASEYLAKHGIKRIYFEDRFMTCAELAEWKNAYPKIEFTEAGGRVDTLREFKDKDEVALIVAAQRIAEKAYDHILDYISPERTEVEVALELEYFMRSQGATGISFETIAVSGKASSLPHGVPRNIPLEKGFLTMDYGAEVDGYRSDMTRTVCIGKADEEMKLIYNTVLRAQLEAEKVLRAGYKCFDADKVARDIITEAGYGPCFGHSLGHGVGLFIHEEPRLSPAKNLKTKLTPGHVITIEPGIYIEGKYGVRIEDMAYIEEDGSATILTDCPKELTELCI